MSTKTWLQIHLANVERGPLPFPGYEHYGSVIAVTADEYAYIREQNFDVLPSKGDLVDVKIHGKDYRATVYQVRPHPTKIGQIVKTQLKGKQGIKFTTAKQMIKWLETDGFVLLSHIKVSDDKKKEERYRQIIDWIGQYGGENKEMMKRNLEEIAQKPEEQK